MRRIYFILFTFHQIVTAQKLLLVITDGLSGVDVHRISSHPTVKLLEDEGVWSSGVIPVFPTLPLPNRHSLLTGLLPKKHGIINDFIYNWKTGELFSNFTKEEDLDRTKWWNVDPIYVTASKAKAAVAAFYLPECLVKWDARPAICIPPSENHTVSDQDSINSIIAATRSHDLVIVYDNSIQLEAKEHGEEAVLAQNASVDTFLETIGILSSEVRRRIDLNLLVVSLHGMVDVAVENVRTLDDFLPMDLINATFGTGAHMQISAKVGKTHQVYSLLRGSSSIPNLQVYYTAPRAGDLPEWFKFKKSQTVADLLLLAEPGYAVLTRDETKQIVVGTKLPRSISGYNNEIPQMSGMMMAYGPVFRRGYRKGGFHLCDLHALMCSLLKVDCGQTEGRIKRIDDILTSDARVEVRRTIADIINSSSNMQISHILYFSMIIVRLL